MANFHRFQAAVALGLLLPLFGCGGNQTAVQGQVTLDGKPLESGTIAFLPVDGTQGPTAGAVISGGRYIIPSSKGPMAGVFRVEINAQKKTGKVLQPQHIPNKPSGEKSEGTFEETVEACPARYNKKSTLRAELRAGKNTLDYELSSEPK